MKSLIKQIRKSVPKPSQIVQSKKEKILSKLAKEEIKEKSNT